MQVSHSADLIIWSPFEPVQLLGHDLLEAASGDMYFFTAQANPVHSASLVALFPLVQHGRACVGTALSLDGVQWSSVTPLLRCAAHGARTEHQVRRWISNLATFASIRHIRC